MKKSFIIIIFLFLCFVTIFVWTSLSSVKNDMNSDSLWVTKYFNIANEYNKFLYIEISFGDEIICNQEIRPSCEYNTQWDLFLENDYKIKYSIGNKDHFEIIYKYDFNYGPTHYYILLNEEGNLIFRDNGLQFK